MDEWRDHRLLVLSKLDRIESLAERLLDKQQEHDREIERLKIRHGLLGFLGGVLGAFGVKFGSGFFNQ